MQKLLGRPASMSSFLAQRRTVSRWPLMKQFLRLGLGSLWITCSPLPIGAQLPTLTQVGESVSLTIAGQKFTHVTEVQWDSGKVRIQHGKGTTDVEIQNIPASELNAINAVSEALRSKSAGNPGAPREVIPGPQPAGSTTGLVNMDLPPPPSPVTTKVNGKTTLPIARIRWVAHEQVSLLSQDDKGGVILNTASGPVECKASDLDLPTRTLLLPDPVLAIAQERKEVERQAQAKKHEAQERAKRLAASPDNNLLADEPLDLGGDHPSGVQTILGTWRFPNQTTRTFEGESLGGTSLSDEGYRDSNWRGTWTREGHSVSFELIFNTGDGTNNAVIGLKDPTYLIGEDGQGNRIRGHKVGYAPREYPRNRPPDGVIEKAPAQLGMVDKDYLRLLRCLCHPWTSDPEQGPDCTLIPAEEIAHRLGSFNGGTNPETRALILELLKHMANVVAAKQGRQASKADFEQQLERTGYNTTTYRQTDGSGNFSGTQTVQTGTSFGDYLDNLVQSSFADASWKANIAMHTGLLEAQYRQTTARLGEMAPKMYETKEVLPRIVSVQLTDKGLIVENVSGYPLTNLTVKLDLFHSAKGVHRDDFRVFYSSCLHAGERRYSSALRLSKSEPSSSVTQSTEKPTSGAILRSIFIPEADLIEAQGDPLKDIKFMRVTAWAREGRQEEERVDVSPREADAVPAKPSNSKDGILKWTNKAGKTIRAVFVRREGGNVVIRNTTGEYFTVPLYTLDEDSQAQAQNNAAK